MDLNLQAVGATVVLGTYFTLGLGLLLHVFFGIGRWGTLWPPAPTGAGGPPEKVTLFLVTAGAVTIFFTVGLVMEDISNKFVDARNTLWSDLNVLPAESQLRMEALFGGFEDGKVNPLGDEWARSGLLDRYGGEHGAEVGEAFRARRFADLQASSRTVRDVASDVYYRAKNTLYREPTFFEELEEIQRRIDFSRSFALLTFFLFLAATAFWLIETAWPGGMKHRSDVWRHLLRRRSWASRPRRPRLNAQERSERRQQAGRRLLTVLPALLVLFVCARVAFAREEREFNVRAYGYFVTWETDGSTSARSETTPPISAMAATSPRGGHLLVVHDTKNDRPMAPRVGILEVDRGGDRPAYVYRSVDVDWSPGGGPSNDLEAACALPQHPGELLVLESGPDLEERPARLFHLRVERTSERWTGSLQRTFHLEAPVGRPPVREIEGMGCVADGRGGVRLLLCERRSEPPPAATAGADVPPSETAGAAEPARAGQPRVAANLRIASVPCSSCSGGGILSLSPPLRDQVRPPAADWEEVEDVRACSDLHVGADGTVWVAAAEDPGPGTGPFRSIVFAAGTFSPDLEQPTLFSDPLLGASFEGMKVEAIGPPILDAFDLSVATDDEAFGGVWRPIRFRDPALPVAPTPAGPPGPSEQAPQPGSAVER